MKKIILSLILSGVCSVAFSAEDSLKDLKDSEQQTTVSDKCDTAVSKDSNPGTKYHDEVVNVEFFKLNCDGNIVSDYIKTFVIPGNLTGSEREVLLDQITIEQKRAREARQRLEERQKLDLMWQTNHDFPIDHISDCAKYENFGTIDEILPRKKEDTSIKIEEHFVLNSFDEEKIKCNIEQLAKALSEGNLSDYKAQLLRDKSSD